MPALRFLPERPDRLHALPQLTSWNYNGVTREYNYNSCYSWPGCDHRAAIAAFPATMTLGATP